MQRIEQFLIQFSARIAVSCLQLLNCSLEFPHDRFTGDSLPNSGGADQRQIPRRAGFRGAPQRRYASALNPA